MCVRCTLGTSANRFNILSPTTIASLTDRKRRDIPAVAAARRSCCRATSRALLSCSPLFFRSRPSVYYVRESCRNARGTRYRLREKERTARSRRVVRPGTDSIARPFALLPRYNCIKCPSRRAPRRAAQMAKGIYDFLVRPDREKVDASARARDRPRTNFRL